MAEDGPRCGAHSRRSGQPCRNWPVAGATRCRMHGGKLPQVQRAAKRRAEEAAARKAVVTFGLPVEIDPHDALLEEVHRTAGHVRWLAAVIGDLDADQLVWGVTEAKRIDHGQWPGDETTRGAAPNVWLTLYQQERAHLAKVAKAAVDAGIDERKVRLAEGQVTMLERAVADTLREVDMPAPVRQAIVQTLAAKLRALPADTA